MALNLRMLRSSDACEANASKSAGDSSPSVAYAHAMLATFCGVKRWTLPHAAEASASKSSGEGRPAVAKAHAVFESSCALSFPALDVSASGINLQMISHGSPLRSPRAKTRISRCEIWEESALTYGRNGVE